VTIELVTGVPGAGKTLYSLAKKVRPLVGKKITLSDCLDSETGKALEVERRLMVCGIRDLLLPHEIVDVAPTHDPWESVSRHPGEKPHDVPNMVQNWWLWCQPGDVIVIDECQRVFRPSAAGQKIPAFIRHLETHRHYGVDFILITQHPQLIHANVRNLIGHHEHVRRIFGGAGTMVYEWDHCTHPDRTKQASGRLWRHDKSAFGLYKSAEVHTKVKHKIPGAVMVAAAGFLALPFAGYQVYDRMTQRYGADAVAAAGPASSPSAPLAPVRLAAASPLQTPIAPTPVVGAASSVAGCVATATRCRCIDSNGEWLTTELKQCQWNAQNLGGWIKYAVQLSPGVMRDRVSRPSEPASGVVESVPLPSPLPVSDVPPVMSAFADGHIRR